MLHWSHANALQVLLLVASWSSSRSSITFGAAAVAAAAATEEEEESHYQRALIIRGTNAVRGRYPYFVTLDHYGGGALIAPDIVLTAGHCKPLNRHQVQPRVGTYSFSQGDDDDHEEFDIVKMVRHPGFVKVDDDDFIHDFTILKLSGLSSNQLVKINRNHHIPSDGQDVIAMGMGNTIPDRDSRAHILQQTTLSAIPNDVCAESVDPDRELSYEGRIFPSMMCTTGGPNNERDACSFDSGSPIIIPKSDDDDEDLLVALVSWGELCADPQFPGVNARVSDASDWIDRMVCELSDNPPAEFCSPPPVEVVVVVVSPPSGSKNLIVKCVVAGMVIAILAALCVLLVTKILRGKDKKYSDYVATGSSEKVSLCESPCGSYHSVEGVEVM